jgi:hypothetical protein
LGASKKPSVEEELEKPTGETNWIGWLDDEFGDYHRLSLDLARLITQTLTKRSGFCPNSNIKNGLPLKSGAWIMLHIQTEWIPWVSAYINRSIFKSIFQHEKPREFHGICWGCWEPTALQANNAGFKADPQPLKVDGEFHTPIPWNETTHGPWYPMINFKVVLCI